MVELKDMNREELLAVIEIKEQIITVLKKEIASYQELLEEIQAKKG